ncbi:MAG: glycosyltransferase family 4 protein [Actinobacteria bacterium]|nr:glycosyltransferase family 4 protein [Actinomycetota bacterium]
MRQKILYLSRTSVLGGAEISLLDLLKKINKQKYHPVVILPDREGLFFKELIENGIEVKIIRMAFLRKTYNVFLLFWFAINIFFVNFYFFFFLLKNNIEVVVCNSFQDSIFVSIPVKLLRRKQVIYIKNILDKKWKKYIRAKICDLFADKVIAISRANAKDFTYFSREKEKVAVIYDGIDIQKFRKDFSKENIYKKYGDTKLRIINIGNLSELKGQKLLVEAICLPKIKRLDLKAFLIGGVNFRKDIKYKNDILELILKNNLEEKVYLLGFQKKIKDYIYYSDVLIHCPTIEEGLGMVVLEAFACGKVVTGTNIGGIPEMIKDKENGFLCKINKYDLAEKILYVYDNINKLESIRNNAIKTVKKDFGLDTKVKKTEKIYQSLFK